MVKILGLKFNHEYGDTKSLRYGHLMIMTDQDHDGSHIKGEHVGISTISEEERSWYYEPSMLLDVFFRLATLPCSNEGGGALPTGCPLASPLIFCGFVPHLYRKTSPRPWAYCVLRGKAASLDQAESNDISRVVGFAGVVGDRSILSDWTTLLTTISSVDMVFRP